MRRVLLSRTGAVAAFSGRGYFTWIQAIVVVLGTRGAASAAAFFGNVLVARQLQPVAFADFYMLFTIMTLVAGLTGPGIDTSLVRFAVRHIGPDRDESAPFFKVVLYIKCLILFFTMLLSMVVARPLLAQFFTHATVPFHSVIFAFFGGATVAMWGFAQSYFLSHQQFNRYAGYEFFSSLLRLGLVWGLLGFDVSNVNIYLYVYVAAPLVMAILSWSQLPGAIFKARARFDIGVEFFHFAKWVLAATLFTTIAQRLDLLLLGYFAVDKDIVGRYGAAVSLVLAGELVLLTFYNVLLPKASQLHSASELRKFIGQFRLPSLMFCLGLTALVPFAGVLRLLAFGESYKGSEDFFTILLIGVIVALACAPAITSLYSLGRPRMVAGFECLRLVLTLGFGCWVVPRYGALGMAFTMAFIRSGISVLTYLVAHRQIKLLSIREFEAVA